MFIFWQSAIVVQSKRRHFVMCYATENTQVFLEDFDSLACPGGRGKGAEGWGVGAVLARPAILKAEKALGTKLVFSANHTGNPRLNQRLL